MTLWRIFDAIAHAYFRWGAGWVTFAFTNKAKLFANEPNVGEFYYVL